MMSKSNRARSRAVRQRMAETGAGYTRAARELGHPTGQAGWNRTDVVRAHICALLLGQAGDTDRQHAEIRALQAQGHRIVDGGQTGPRSWEIFDWATGQEIVQGDDGLEGYDAAAERLDPEGTWVHIDRIASDPSPLPVTAGIPESLSEALAEWIGQTRTSDEEIAEFIGWPVDRVKNSR